MKNVRVFVILNPNSRRFVFSKLQKNLSKFLTNHTIIYKKTDYPSHATKILSELNFKDYDFIICVGGDGTINEVINGMNLMKTTPLAIIPFGTANVLSYELGINSSFNRSLKTIKENRILKSYFGIAGSKKFLSMLGVGFDAYVISKIDLKLKKRYGKLIYFYETIKSLLVYKFPSFEAYIENKKYKVYSLIALNSRYYGGSFKITNKTNICEKKLFVILFLKKGIWQSLCYSILLLLGKIELSKNIITIEAKKILLKGKNIYMHVDGDIIDFKNEIIISESTIPIKCFTNPYHR